MTYSYMNSRRFGDPWLRMHETCGSLKWRRRATWRFKWSYRQRRLDPSRAETAIASSDGADSGIRSSSGPGGGGPWSRVFGPTTAPNAAASQLQSVGIVHEVSASISASTALFNMEAPIREHGIGSTVSLQDSVGGVGSASELSRMERRPSPAAVTPGETSSSGGQRTAQASSVGDSDQTKRRRRESANQRAAQACLRCRKQKLRCLGGNPCLRCVKRRISCNFKGKESQQVGEDEFAVIDQNSEAVSVTGELGFGEFLFA